MDSKTVVCIALLVAGCGGSTATEGGGGTGGAGATTASGGHGSGGQGGAQAGCPQASVTFRMVPGGTPGTTFCVGADCSSAWLSLHTDSGAPLLLSSDCAVLCDGCASTGCSGACYQPYLLDAAGEQRDWDGAYWALDDGCGGGCLAPACATVGMALVATFCAYRPPDNATTCVEGLSPTCVDVPFQYGVDAEVVGVLDSTK
jgi:hypothetical protein